jgi:hypothetical protein
MYVLTHIGGKVADGHGETKQVNVYVDSCHLPWGQTLAANLVSCLRMTYAIHRGGKERKGGEKRTTKKGKINSPLTFGACQLLAKGLLPGYTTG